VDARSMIRVIAASAVMLFFVGTGLSQTAEPPTTQRIALLTAIEGVVGPATARHIEIAVRTAREHNAEVLILRINTPGGLATSMREIIAEILGSTIPVVGWVAPPGAHAASAGTYILYATHVAAMAPGTNLGAATPVQIGGGFPGMPQERQDERKEEKKGDEKAKDEKGLPSGSTMDAKAVNDAVAFIRSLAEMRGRNAEWAERAVREAASLSAERARDEKVIDLVAEDVPALLAAVDGRSVLAGGVNRTLATQGLTVERLDPGIVTRMLGILADPNVAFLLLMIGVYGLIFEFVNPGAIGPGVIGAICLVLGLYALNQLPLNYAGLALIALGIAMMVAEAITPTFGVLGLGGGVALVIGAAMLIDADVPAFRISWWVIAGTATVSGGVLIMLLGYVWRTHRRGPVADLVGVDAQVLSWSGEQGYVWAQGERWRARGAAGLVSGEQVRVSGRDGLTLVIGNTSNRRPHDEEGEKT